MSDSVEDRSEDLATNTASRMRAVGLLGLTVTTKTFPPLFPPRRNARTFNIALRAYADPRNEATTMKTTKRLLVCLCALILLGVPAALVGALAELEKLLKHFWAASA